MKTGTLIALPMEEKTRNKKWPIKRQVGDCALLKQCLIAFVQYSQIY
jgi:hypothetical protein